VKVKKNIFAMGGYNKYKPRWFMDEIMWISLPKTLRNHNILLFLHRKKNYPKE